MLVLDDNNSDVIVDFVELFFSSSFEVVEVDEVRAEDEDDEEDDDEDEYESFVPAPSFSSLLSKRSFASDI